MSRRNKVEKMMATLVMLPSKFDFNSSNLSSAWTQWRNCFKILLTASNKDNDEENSKIALLLNLMGDESIKIYSTFKNENESLESVIEHFNHYFEPKENVIYRRYKFYSYKQEEGQSVNSFVINLKSLAASCYFQDEDEVIRDRVVMECCSDELRELLFKKGNLTLEEAVKICNNEVNNVITASSNENCPAIKQEDCLPEENELWKWGHTENNDLNSHFEESSLQCGCGEQFPEETFMIKHMQVNAMNLPTVCKCCNKEIKLSCVLRRHSYEVLKQGVKHEEKISNESFSFLHAYEVLKQGIKHEEKISNESFSFSVRGSQENGEVFKTKVKNCDSGGDVKMYSEMNVLNDEHSSGLVIMPRAGFSKENFSVIETHNYEMHFKDVHPLEFHSEMQNCVKFQQLGSSEEELTNSDEVNKKWESYSKDQLFQFSQNEFRNTSKDDFERLSVTNKLDSSVQGNSLKHTYKPMPNLKRHSKTQSKRNTINCCLCKFACVKMGTFMQHMAKRHKGEKSFQCKSCDFECGNLHNFKKHLLSHIYKKSYLVCKFCTFTSKNKKKLERHMRIHHEAKSIKCVVCGVTCRSKNSRRIHMMTHMETFQCSVCHYECKEKSVLKKHLRSHENKNPYKCMY